jgi:hypothetical protein
MSTKLTYGSGIICELEGVDVVRAKGTSTIDVDDVATQVQQEFNAPLDYPPLASATVPGDTVAIALTYGTPRMFQVVAGTLSALESAGVEKSNISILLAPEFATDPIAMQMLRDFSGEEVSISMHLSDDEEHLALLGVTKAGGPLRLNRLLCDADLVIPIGPTRGSDNQRHPAGMLFPLFSDQESVGRFNSPAWHESDAARHKLESEAGECDWMLGVGLALQVIPGPLGEIAGLYCGTPNGVRAAAERGYREIWSTEVKQRADLIVATIVGNEAQQTWQNLSRALAIADELLEPGGAIAICSEIATRPGPSGKRLRNAQDLAAVERKLLTDQFTDSAAALFLCRSLQRGTVYLKSQLDPAIVEGLGLAPISSDQEIERLTNAYRRCLVLEEAQHLEPKLVNA